MDIFVGGIPFKIKEGQLREIFEKYGEVTSVKIIINKATRQNKGFAFVQMPDDSQAIKAIEALNGSEVMDRRIVVSKSEEKADRQKRPQYGNKKDSASGTENDGFYIWPSKLYPKKKKNNALTWGGESKKDGPENKKPRGKLAKNFKVGKRKK